MLAKRIIPCLDIKNGRTVKGTNFKSLRDAGNPIDLARRYEIEGADELVFLDIAATLENRGTLYDMVEKVAQEVSIPFTVGGGISEVDQVGALLKRGADKVSVNSSAVKYPNLIQQIADRYGSQCVVVAMDAASINGNWVIHTHGGQQPTDLYLFDWAQQAEKMGAGEILFTSMDHDGTKKGFALEALKQLSEVVHLPIIASGGAGKIDDFVDLFSKTEVTGALAASIFHFQEVEILDLKKTCEANQILMR